MKKRGERKEKKKNRKGKEEKEKEKRKMGREKEMREKGKEKSMGVSSFWVLKPEFIAFSICQKKISFLSILSQNFDF